MSIKFLIQDHIITLSTFQFEVSIVDNKLHGTQNISVLLHLGPPSKHTRIFISCVLHIKKILAIQAFFWQT